jgi:hypothetical protein
MSITKIAADLYVSFLLKERGDFFLTHRQQNAFNPILSATAPEAHGFGVEQPDALLMKQSKKHFMAGQVEKLIFRDR